MAQKKTAKARYTELAPRREPFLRRGRRYAEPTIPSLLPPEGHTQVQDLPEPYQSFGARLVTSLASRMMTAFLPPGQKAFKLEIPAEVLLKQGQQTAGKDVEQGLTLSESVIQGEINRNNWRAPTYTALQHLIVTGNALEQMLPNNTLRIYRLDQFVVVREPAGRVIEIVVEEHLAPTSLPEELRALVDAADLTHPTIPLYTWVKWDSATEKWLIHQEIGEIVVPKSRGKYKVSPFTALRWTEVIGEDYGRAKVEEHIGDLGALEGLSKSMLEGAAMASRHITLIRPNAAGGLNLRRRLTSAKNGDFVVGNPDDVEMMQFQNQAGLQVVSAEIQNLKAELGAAFLLNSAARRDAERVTAYELKKMIEEIESVLGGVYTSLAEVMQGSRFHRLILQMKAQKKLPDWPDGIVEPTLLTGMEAIGREKDVERVASAAQLLQGLPPEVVQDYVKWESMLGKAFNGLQLPDSVRTDEEVEQRQKQRAMVEAMAKAAAGMAGDAQGQAAPAAPQAA